MQYIKIALKLMYNSLAIIIMHAAVLVLNREAEQIVVCQLC